MIAVIGPIIQAILSAVLPWLFNGQKAVTVLRSNGGCPGLDRATNASRVVLLLLMLAVCAWGGETVIVESTLGYVTSHGKGVLVEIPGCDRLMLATAWHVVEDGGTVVGKTPDGSTFVCTLCRSDKEQDVALLKTTFSTRSHVEYVRAADIDPDPTETTLTMTVKLKTFELGCSGSPVWRGNRLAGIAISKVIFDGKRATENLAVAVPAAALLKLAGVK